MCPGSHFSTSPIVGIAAATPAPDVAGARVWCQSQIIGLASNNWGQSKHQFQVPELEPISLATNERTAANLGTGPELALAQARWKRPIRVSTDRGLDHPGCTTATTARFAPAASQPFLLPFTAERKYMDGRTHIAT